MKYLVTGGVGFIGGNFINYLLSEHPEDRIVCLDKLTYAANPATISAALSDARFSFVRGDIADKNCVDGLFRREKFDVVVNFAAESHVDRSILSPDVFLTSNIIGTHVLLEACLKYGVGRFHQISTDEVYGDLPLDCTDIKFAENSPLRPSSPYSASKASADLLVMAYHRTYGLPVTISRSSNNYGAYQHPEKLVPLAITRALEGKSIPVYGDGKNVRDWLHVYDHCRAIDLIMRGGHVGGIYNVGGGCEMANIDVVRLILKELGRSEKLITYVPDRKGHDKKYSLDCGKIFSDLGWKAEVKFSEGIKNTVRWYIENAAWLQSFPRLRTDK